MNKERVRSFLTCVLLLLALGGALILITRVQ